MPCELFAKPAQAYTVEQRNFALTLHLYSPKAYRYLKDKFGFALPDERTLRRYLIQIRCKYIFIYTVSKKQGNFAFGFFESNGSITFRFSTIEICNSTNIIT